MRRILLVLSCGVALSLLLTPVARADDDDDGHAKNNATVQALPACAGAVVDNSRSTCETCIVSSQCKGADFCCPWRKECLPSGAQVCRGPAAGCSRRCPDSKCSAKDGCPSCTACNTGNFSWVEWATLVGSDQDGDQATKTCNSPSVSKRRLSRAAVGGIIAALMLVAIAIGFGWLKRKSFKREMTASSSPSPPVPGGQSGTRQ